MHQRLLVSTEVPLHSEKGSLVTDFKVSCVAWRKSTASNSGACVEVATVDGSVLVRDSMNRTGPILQMPSSAWSAFLVWTRGTRARTAGHRQA
jgi:Domain of unknown function (DUF397)